MPEALHHQVEVMHVTLGSNRSHRQAAWASGSDSHSSSSLCNDSHLSTHACDLRRSSVWSAEWGGRMCSSPKGAPQPPAGSLVIWDHFHQGRDSIFHRKTVALNTKETAFSVTVLLPEAQSMDLTECFILCIPPIIACEQWSHFMKNELRQLDSTLTEFTYLIPCFLLSSTSVVGFARILRIPTSSDCSCHICF